MKRTAQIELTINFGNGGSLSPEDLLLIDHIRRERSILGAARASGISYRKCWLMVDALNRTFETPVFETHPGRRGGGAEITPFGERLIALYQSMQRRTRTATTAALTELQKATDPHYQKRASGAAEAAPKAEPRRARSRRS
ncbi:putative Transcriptional regulatory protein, lysR family [Bradyrhizobium sp. ORS 285]|uniref:winged helix-turn-helix domain-containing protein n=1 Tax=Bradyrhizobium sp. ORS 285 TaxID=115808 RepID=UPI0002409509|nr:LysR family transcriptional regulator [Bradyrhizobium sp. ORS 285]CCD87510.1 putative Transcriptional regulatory protein, lysR family; molybdenum transport regulator, modE [Bradyrhizobium sp. ORS 285]SMX60337.1 putative Transcriptional regulatory protein, lysR family [Bradyrhizobium sp. ORS 285]